MFAGLTSRWTSPCACAAASPAAVCIPIRRISGSGSGPVRSSRSWSESPETNCITRYGSGPASSTAWMVTTWSWVTAAAARASRTNRLPRGGAGRQLRGHHLDRDDPVELLVEGPEDDPHPAAADDLRDLVVPQPAERLGLRRRSEEVERVVRASAPYRACGSRSPSSASRRDPAWAEPAGVAEETAGLGVRAEALDATAADSASAAQASAR